MKIELVSRAVSQKLQMSIYLMTQVSQPGHTKTT